MNRRSLIVTVFAITFCAAPLVAQEETFTIEPAQSHVAFTLGDIFHTVHGTFQMKSGTIHFDPATGVASGQLVVDATSGNSGSGARDHKMNKDILESQKYPEVIFAVDQVKGALAPSGASTLQVSGNFILHGQSHPLTLSIPVQVTGQQAAADILFNVPYVQWGLKDPSTLFLRVSKDVQIAVHAVGRLEPAASAAAR
jgi:polyisoprenoid-binding protein YceI